MGKRRTKTVEFSRIMGGGGGGSTFCMIYESLLKNEYFQQLDGSLRYFYICCLSEWRSRDGRSCLYQHRQESQREYSIYSFVFPAKHLKQYGIDRGNASRYFDDLIALGLLRKLENNKLRQKVNVYEILDGWNDLPEKLKALKEEKSKKKSNRK